MAQSVLTMYQPIPGFAHLKLYRAPDEVRYERVPAAADIIARDSIRELVTIAVEVAAGLRHLQHLRRDHFDEAIGLHLRLWKKAHGIDSGAASGELLSLHARSHGEYFGSARIAQRRHAFTGSAANGKLLTFRLL
ncbi:hypothetical protein ACWIB8_04815 [Corynebacterium flavescens]